VPRRVEISVDTESAQRLVLRISEAAGVIGLQVQRGSSRIPPGDVIIVDITNRGLPDLVRLLAEEGVGQTASASWSTSEPVSMVSSTSADDIARDSSEAIWEEMDSVIAKNSNMTVNATLIMVIAGVIATIGIATNALHIVLGAMLIAPGFQPIVRIALGSEASYLPAGVLISYWTSITAPGLVVTATAGAAGAILIATDRAVLTAGVMVALALVPGAAVAGLATASGDLGLAASGALRWLLEVVIVLAASTIVLSWKKASVHRRTTLTQPH
jgi:uncharacterized membrane protein